MKTVLETYVFADYKLAIALLALALMDTLLGIYKSWKNGTLEAKAYRRIIEKLMLYGGALITITILTNFADGAAGWLDNTTLGILIVYEGWSIFENIAEINPTLFPPSMLKRLKNFDENGNLKATNQ